MRRLVVAVESVFIRDEARRNMQSKRIRRECTLFNLILAWID